MSDEKPTVPEYSRREFLGRTFKKAAAIGATILSSQIQATVSAEQELQAFFDRQARDREKRKAEYQKSKEKFPVSRGVLMVDFASDYQREKALINLLGDKYLSDEQLESEFGKLDTAGKSDLDLTFERRAWLDKVYDKYPENAIARGVLDVFNRHGDGVAMVISGVGEVLKTNIIPEISALQASFRPKPLRTTKDELGNQTYWYSIGSTEIGEELQKYPDQKVVNFSFELGEMGWKNRQRYLETDRSKTLEYKVEERDGQYYVYFPEKVETRSDGFLDVTYPPAEWVIVDGKEQFRAGGVAIKPLSQQEYKKFKAEQDKNSTVIKKSDGLNIEIMGAYSGEQTEKSVNELISICHRFPDKLFCVAGGNWGEDFRTVRESRKGDWPDNLLIVAQWSYDKNNGAPTHSVYGADLYIPNSALEMPEGSSFSTPVVSAMATFLISKGATLQAAKNIILSLSQEKDFSVKDGDRTLEQKAKMLPVTVDDLTDTSEFGKLKQIGRQLGTKIRAP